MGYYHTAQVCLNGHCITSAVDSSPNLSEKFCSKCSAPTITNCPKCSSLIRGEYEVPGLIDWTTSYTPPAYCPECGNPFPWTESALNAASELIEEEDKLNDIERKKLIESLPALIVETPNTQIAVVRLKKALKSVEQFTADSLRQFAIDFGCELVKKQLGL